jgi:hypothetical protein
MAQQTINIGTAPNDGTGTPLRTSFDYCNLNFTELYTAVGPSGNNIVVPGTATITGDLTVDTSTLFVDSANDRVGVGTATPYALLHANGTIAAANFDWTSTLAAPTVGLLATSNNSSASIRIATLDSNPTHDPFVNFLTSGGQNWSIGIDNSDSDKFKIALTNGFTGSSEIFAADPSGVFSWFDGAGGTRMTLNSTGLGVGGVPSGVNRFAVWNGATQALTLDTSGDLLVNNVSSGDFKLQVSGTNVTSSYAARFAGGSTTSNGVFFYLPGTRSSDTTYFLQRYGDDSSIRFQIFGNGNVQNTTGTYGTISDLRLKENISDARNYLADLLKLRVVKYSLKADASPTANLLGLIAQEVEQVFPTLVETSGDDVKSVKTTVLIPMLLKAIQELTARVQTLEAR